LKATPLRIGFFSPTINRIGGGEWITLNMIHALVLKGHEVLVYSAEKVNPKHIQDFYGRPLRFNEINFPSYIFDPFNLESIYPNCIRSLLLKTRCDLLIDTFSNVLLPWSNAVYFHAPSRGFFLPKNGLKGLILMPYRSILTYAQKHANPEEKILMACSKWTAKIAKIITGLDLKVVYPPISDFFKINTEKIQAKKDIIVTVSRISHEKRLETIPQIAKMVNANLKFIIISKCDLPSEIEGLKKLKKSIKENNVENKIDILLNISREKQREILQQSKVYLHPNVIYETFGVSILEAMSAGCVAIAPNKGGIKEFVPDKLRYNDIEEAASLVEIVIANWSPKKAKESTRISEKFSQQRFQKEFLETMKL
jgi:glycosyltransferase involved in cell wall biosynthesis